MKKNQEIDTRKDVGNPGDMEDISPDQPDEPRAGINEEPPDGGILAWLQVLGGFFCNFNSWGVINSFGVFQEYYNDNLLEAKSPGQISWIGALAGTLAFGSTTIFGPALDAGYHSWLVAVAGIVQCFALMMLSLSEEYYQVMLTQGALLGLASGILFLVSMASVAPYFSSKRALAIGIVMSGSSIGGVVYSSAARQLLPHVGFGWTARILGFIVLGTSSISSLCIRRRLPRRKFNNFIAFECFHEPVFMLYSISSTSAFCGLYLFYFHFQAYALSQYPHETTFFFITALVNAGSVTGRIIPNYLSEHLGLFNILLFTDVSCMIMAFCWIAAKSESSIIAIAVLFGIFSGPRMGLPGVIAAKLTANLNRLGVRLSLTLLFHSIGVLLGPPFAGVLMRKYGWFWAELYCALAWAVSSLLVVCARHTLACGRILVKV